MSSEKEKYFMFMDESGNNDQDRFFILGILMIKAEEIGSLFNYLEKISSKIKNESNEAKSKRIDEEFKQGNIEKVIKTAKSNRVFEMKFSSINKENEELYKKIIETYFKLKNVRFSCIVFDKEQMQFKPDEITHWNRYLNNAAMLIANNAKHLPNAEFVLIADQISQPRSEKIAYENALKEKLTIYLKKKGILENCVWGTARIESHSSTFLQLTDILVGAVGHDFIGEDKERKEGFMELFRTKLNTGGKIQDNLNRKTPNYFSVWKYKAKS